MKILKKVKNDFIYYCTILVIRFFNVIPRGPAVFIGGAFGYGAYLISGKDRARAHHTLGIAYGDSLSAGQKREIIRSLFINFGKNIADVVRFKKYYNSQIKDLIDVEGLEHFDRVYKRGKGVIAVTGHIGNFELLAAFFVSSGYNAAVIGRELYDGRLDKLLVDNRQAIGIVNISTQDSPRRILKALKDGYALGVLIDTDSMRVRSEFIPAFGKLSYTPVGQSILGLKTGAGFVPMACVRKGRRYEVIVRPEIAIERTNDFDKDVYNITKKCTEALEEIINEHKDQWIWIHNRWLTRPKKPIDK
ncbi:MAG: lysophospholipid acyltransferase family protein [Candidatus Zixiibacteriota bacterium]|nr:MAG: lysophospholipid acyltransferase family protein [candidate division Zixibacteria bacterium]